MEFINTEIPEVIICKPKIHGDERGYFTETFRTDLLEEYLGYKVHFCQDNESKSGYGVLRGLHYQVPPFAQAKLVRVLDGLVLDVAVDIREDSLTFGKSVAVELSSENKKQLFIPRGFAHGFVVLSETATFAYKCDNYYSKSHDRGILFKDEKLKIDWKIPFENMILSEKDKNQPELKIGKNINFPDKIYQEI